MKYFCETCGMEFEDSDCFNFSIEADAPCPVCVASNALRVIRTYEPVAQWEKRKGRKYPDTAPVYAKMIGYEYGSWLCETYINAKIEGFICEPFVVATEAGAPPDDWRPE